MFLTLLLAAVIDVLAFLKAATAKKNRSAHGSCVSQEIKRRTGCQLAFVGGAKSPSKTQKQQQTWRREESWSFAPLCSQNHPPQTPARDLKETSAVTSKAFLSKTSPSAACEKQQNFQQLQLKV